MNLLRSTFVCRSKIHLGSARLSHWRVANGARTTLGLCCCCPRRFEPLRAGPRWLLLSQTSRLQCENAQWLMRSPGIPQCDFFAEAPKDAERSRQVARRADHGRREEGDRTDKRPLVLPSFVLSRSLFRMERVAEVYEERKISPDIMSTLCVSLLSPTPLLQGGREGNIRGNVLPRVALVPHLPWATFMPSLTGFQFDAIPCPDGTARWLCRRKWS